MSALGFAMLSGQHGAASYAENSGPQNCVLLRCRPMLEKAIALQQASLLEMKDKQGGGDCQHDYGKLNPALHDERSVFRVADIGCSSGFNCLANMQFIADTIRKYAENKHTELQCFFSDLPSNDFNALFQLIHQYAHQHYQPGSFFSAAVADTMYGRLFPAASLHLIFSSHCLHWLSQVPEVVSVPHTLEWNKGKIWVDGPLANEATRRAYANQWQKDLKTFLECRNLELAKGGTMFLIMLCRPDSFPPDRMQNGSCASNLEVSWQQLIAEGVVEQSDLDTFNIPMYAPSLGEIKHAIHSLPANLTIQSLDIIEEPIGENYWRQWSHDLVECAIRLDNHYRSLFWNVIEGHVGMVKCEAIFNRFKELIMQNLQSQSSWDSFWVQPWSSFAIMHIVKQA